MLDLSFAKILDLVLSEVRKHLVLREMRKHLALCEMRKHLVLRVSYQKSNCLFY